MKFLLSEAHMIFMNTKKSAIITLFILLLVREYNFQIIKGISVNGNENYDGVAFNKNGFACINNNMQFDSNLLTFETNFDFNTTYSIVMNVINVTTPTNVEFTGYETFNINYGNGFAVITIDMIGYDYLNINTYNSTIRCCDLIGNFGCSNFVFNQELILTTTTTSVSSTTSTVGSTTEGFMILVNKEENYFLSNNFLMSFFIGIDGNIYYNQTSCNCSTIVMNGISSFILGDSNIIFT